MRGETQAVFGREEEEVMVLRNIVRILAFAGVCALAAGVNAQDFEPPTYTGSAGGTVLTGQPAANPWYNPVPATSVDFNVYTYAGGAFGIPPNPTGGTQFAAAEGPAGGVFGRAQRDIVWPTGTATVGYDMAAAYTGASPSSNNVGSFSSQLFPGEATYIHLFSWTDPAALLWQADYLGYDAAGVLLPQPGMSPGPAWQNLVLNHWYRFETTMDFVTNEVTGASITDITAGTTTTATLSGVYLEGGSAGGLAPPSGYRMFAGGGTAGNVTAWDNLTIVPEPATLALLAFGAMALLRRR